MRQQELAERYPQLAEMADGDSELMLDLLEMFLIQTPELMQQLMEGLHPLERSSVYAASHTLKPTLRYLGMDRLSDLAREIEEGARNEAVRPEQLVTSSESLRDCLQTELDRLRELVHHHRPSLS